jgi:hypothetical protein
VKCTKFGCMRVWMDGWLSGWMDVWMDGGMDGEGGERKTEWTDGRTDT